MVPYNPGELDQADANGNPSRETKCNRVAMVRHVGMGVEPLTGKRRKRDQQAIEIEA